MKILPDGAMSDSEYLPGPDSQPHPDVPRGRLEEYVFSKSKFFPGTTRSYWVYAPTQYDGKTPACVMVVQDGGGWSKHHNLPVVLDNLIHKKEIPVTIGIFISPGQTPEKDDAFYVRRSFEYDSLGDRYVRFLLEEIFPEVEKKYALAQDGGSRAIFGGSSGAICAFTAAWERPDAFQRVFSYIGTYTGMRGGHEYPYLVRVTEPKPIRIFIEDGSRDLNIFAGNWWLANQEMLSSLEFSGYEVKHAWGDGEHNAIHTREILPDALRWLWKGHPSPITTGTNSRQSVMQILIPGEEWQEIKGDYQNALSLAANKTGEIYFAEAETGNILKIDTHGEVRPVYAGSERIQGMAFSADGKIYASQYEKKRVIVLDETGTLEQTLEGISADNLCVSANGFIYTTDSRKGHLSILFPGGKKRVMDKGLPSPTCAHLTASHTHLIVGDRAEPRAYLYKIRANGFLTNKLPFFHLNVGYEETKSGTRGIAIDRNGWVYFATSVGIQCADREGRMVAVLLKPNGNAIDALSFGGREFNELFIACGGRIYRRKTRVTGISAFVAPFQPESRKSW